MLYIGNIGNIKAAQKQSPESYWPLHHIIHMKTKQRDRMRRRSLTLTRSIDLLSMSMLRTNRSSSFDCASFWIRPPSRQVSASPIAFSRRTRDSFLSPSPVHTRKMLIEPHAGTHICTRTFCILSCSQSLGTFPAHRWWNLNPHVRQQNPCNGIN